MKIKFITLFLFFISLDAQSGLSITPMNQDSDKKNTVNQFPLYNNVKQKEVVSDAIDSKSFIVGPGDILMVDIVTSNLVNQFDLIISVTGDLIIPLVGKVSMNGKSLEEAINSIEASFKKQYSDAQLSIILKDAGNYNLYVKHPYGLNNQYEVLWGLYDFLQSS